MTIEKIIPPPPRPPCPAWSRRVYARYVKSLLGALSFDAMGSGLIVLQFLVPEETPWINRLAMGVFALPMFVMAVLLHRSGARERSQAMGAWERWNLGGMKREGGVDKPAEAASLDLQGILAGRAHDEYFVLVDPNYRFNRRRIEPDLLRELSGGNPEG
jgi:hypothetical protein